MDAIVRAIELSLIQREGAHREEVRKDVSEILAFVEEVRSIAIPSQSYDGATTQQNVMRDDVVTVPAATYREAVLAQAPLRHKDWIAVKKFLR